MAVSLDHKLGGLGVCAQEESNGAAFAREGGLGNITYSRAKTPDYVQRCNIILNKGRYMPLSDETAEAPSGLKWK